MSDNKPPTKAELTAQKIRMVRAMIGQRAHTSDIKRAFAIRFKTTPRAAERFITLAYELIRQETSRPLDEHRQEANEFYRDIVANTQAPLRDRIRAQENIDKILGLNAPIKVASTDSDGKDIPPSLHRTFEQVAAELNALISETLPETP